MLQRDDALAVERIGDLVEIDQALLEVDFGALLRLRFFKYNIVILKDLALGNRQVEARVAAHTERQRLAARVFHLKFRRDAAARQRVGHREAEVVGVLLFRLRIALDDERDGVPALFGHRELAPAHKAVAVHFKPFALDARAAAAQRADNREQNRRLAAPVFRVSLPDVLEAVAALKRDELSAERVDFSRNIFILYVDPHNPFPFCIQTPLPAVRP